MAIISVLLGENVHIHEICSQVHVKSFTNTHSWKQQQWISSESGLGLKIPSNWNKLKSASK